LPVLIIIAALVLGGCSAGRDASLSVRLTYPQEAKGAAAQPRDYPKPPANRILIRVLAPHIPTPIEAWFDRAAGRGVISGIPPGERIVVEVDEYDNTAVTLGTDAPLLGRGWAQGVTLAAGESKTVAVPMYAKGTIARVCGADNTAGGGSGTPGDTGDGGLAVDALLGQPLAVKVGPGDEIFVSSAMYNRVRKIDRFGYIAHYAGNGSPANLVNGEAASTAPIGAVYEMDFSSTGDLYVITWDQQIIGVDGGTGQIAIRYDAQRGNFNTAIKTDLAVVNDNTIYYTNAMENRVYLVQDGIRLDYVIDNTSLVTDSEGVLRTSTVVKAPAGVTVDPEANGVIYCSKDSNRIKRLESVMGVIFTLVGSAAPLPYADNIVRTDMAPQKPYLIEYDRYGGMRYFFAEEGLHTIKSVRLDVSPNTVWTLAGNGTLGYSGDGGPATAAKLNNPRSVTTDSRGNVYIADTDNHAVRMVVGGALP